jgi:hypothetical protein
MPAAGDRYADCRRFIQLSRITIDHIGAPTRLGEREIMGPVSLIKESWEIVPILLLLVVGVAIAIASGVHHLASRRDVRLLAGNLSRILLRVIGYLAALLMLHELLGIRALSW